MSMTKYGISDAALDDFQGNAKKAQALPDPATLQDRLVDGAVRDLARNKGVKTATTSPQQRPTVATNVSRPL